jgi:hypothetical protein
MCCWGAAAQSIAFFTIAIGIRVGSYSMSIFTIAFTLCTISFSVFRFCRFRGCIPPGSVRRPCATLEHPYQQPRIGWIFVYVLVLVMPLGITNLSWRFYLMLGFFNIAMLPIPWLFYVETSKLTLEQIDRPFEVYSEGQEHKMPLGQARKQVLIEAEVVGNAGGNGLVMQTLGTTADGDHLADVVAEAGQCW